MGKDSLYSRPQSNIGDFVFDEKVAACFDDMIIRSVPGYASIIAMVGVLAEQYAQDNTRCYDLGCSLGAGIVSMRQRITRPGIKIIGVDNSAAMLERCRQNVERSKAGPTVELISMDIRDCEIADASVVVMNFTLQFIDENERQDLIDRIYAGMRPGGIFILSEKIAFEEKDEEALQTKLYHNFKKLNGYSDLEIAQKRTALENVLVPDTLGEHRDRLDIAGFKSVNIWFQCFNFMSLVAIK